MADSSMVNTLETLLREGLFRDILITVRRTEVSCLESPYVLYNVHFSGACQIQCRDCHSKALWESLPEDRTDLNTLLTDILKQYKAGLTEGIGLMGTDTSVKEVSFQIVNFAHRLGLVTVVYSGYDFESARVRYGSPDFYVCGPYRHGEWWESKTFHRRTFDNEGKPTGYEKISRDEYFTR